MTTLRVFYALGPGDVVESFRQWKVGAENEFEMSIAFSGLFFDWCRDNGIEAHAVSWNPRPDSERAGALLVENQPKPEWCRGGGLRFHLGLAGYGLSLVAQALRERPKVAVIDSGTTHWIVLSLLSLIGVPVIAVMHSALWPTGFEPEKRSEKLLRKLDGVFFRHFAAATVSVSPECERQVRKVAGRVKGPMLQCRAQFTKGFLDRTAPAPKAEDRPFKVLFVGRVEEYKGVFDIVRIAEQLERELPGQFVYRIIGGGAASEELSRRVAERGLEKVVELPGRLPRAALIESLGWSHVMIVPTTGAYSEGLAMTAAEAVLAGRPVLLSTVVPAREVLGEAAIAVAPGDVAGYVAALRRMAEEPGWYERCQTATASVQAQFYDVEQGLGAAIGRAIGLVLGGDTATAAPPDSRASAATA